MQGFHNFPASARAFRIFGVVLQQLSALTYDERLAVLGCVVVQLAEELGRSPADVSAMLREKVSGFEIDEDFEDEEDTGDSAN